MKKIIAIPVLVMALCLSPSCKKKLASSDQELAGTWSNHENTTLKIESDGKGNYDYNDGSSSEYIHGKVKVDGSTITFKALGIKKSFSIEKRPYTESTKTKMVLDGDVYEKR